MPTSCLTVNADIHDIRYGNNGLHGVTECGSFDSTNSTASAEPLPVIIGEQNLHTTSTHPVLKTCFDVGNFETPTIG